jgi:hypothetical protein
VLAALRLDTGRLPLPRADGDRDVTFKEDSQRLPAGTSAQIAATIRSAAAAALRLAGFASAAADRRWASCNPARSLAALDLIRE